MLMSLAQAVRLRSDISPNQSQDRDLDRRVAKAGSAHEWPQHEWRTQMDKMDLFGLANARIRFGMRPFRPISLLDL